MPNSNIKRLLADVVSVDAWHTPFDGTSGVANVHIDVVFGEARIGGEKEAPVRFRLALKRAEVVVVIPEYEPLSVKRGSVSRDQPNDTVRVTRKSERTSSGQIALGVQPRFPVAASISANASVSAGRKSTETFESDEQLKLVLITQSKSADGFYRWECVPSLGSKLQGRPWEPKDAPRLSVDDTRATSHHLKGAMRVEVRCRREDLAIEDIQLKDDSFASRLKAASLLTNKIAAVEAYLTYLLASEQLHFNNISDPYGKLCVADVMVEESDT